MNGQERVYCLQLDQYLFTYDEIGPESYVKIDALVPKRNGNLTPARKLRLLELMSQAGFIRTFQQARSQFPMHLNCRSNDPLRDFSMKKFSVVSVVQTLKPPPSNSPR
jgi:hypothetical protein